MEISVVAEISCVLIASHPILPISLYKNISTSIIELLKNNQAKWLLGNAFLNIRHSFSFNEDYATVLLQVFEEFVIC